jgi:hypothetical protein
MPHLMSQKDEYDGDGVARTSCDPCGGYCQNEKSNMDDISSHEDSLLLFLMAIPVEHLFVFMFPHLFPSFLDHATHNLISFSILNPQSHWFGFSRHRRGPEFW